MNKFVLVTSVFILTACAGGTGSTGPQGKPGTPGQNGAQGVPGKSAYEIWLEAGNTGTEQDFLDSLVGNKEDTPTENAPTHYKNTHESLEYTTKNYPSMGTYTKTDMAWNNHNGYKQYIHEQTAPSNTNEQKIVYTYNEKELSLANYGVYLRTIQYDFETEPNYGYVYAYIHNRDGIGANVYTPEEGTVFKGGTLAYLSNGYNDTNPTLIKGDSKFTYNAKNPSLELNFDNWYTLIFSSPYGDNKYSVKTEGQNNTGDINLSIKGTSASAGDYSAEVKTLIHNHVKKNNVEETVGTYSVQFDRGTTVSNDDLHLEGAFGGTKQ